MLRQPHTPHDPEAADLELEGVELRYGTIPALEAVSFRVEAGERMAVIGPNGAGKSTLFKAISGLMHPTAGRIRVGGSHPALHTCIAYLAQRSDVDWHFPITVLEAVLMGRIGRIGLFRHAGRKDRQIASDCLATVGLADLARRRIDELSGGQQQRMFIARALAQEAGIMLMDEPFAGLDAPAREDIFTILDDLKKRNVAVLVALHDLHLAATRFDRVLLLNRRIIAAGPARDVLTPPRLEAAYGGRLHVVQTADGHVIFTDSCCEGG
ncbi:MAG: metal ABC transporter ATP-binding protein [Kiritimatiellia bacterium]